MMTSAKICKKKTLPISHDVIKFFQIFFWKMFLFVILRLCQNLVILPLSEAKISTFKVL